MALALTSEHRDFAAAIDAFAERRGLLSSVRGAYEGEDQALKTLRAELSGQGWLGVHVAEEYGGQGYGLAELAVVVERLGAGLTAFSVLPTLVASAALQLAGSPEQRSRWLPGLADGSVAAALYLGDALHRSEGDRLHGELGLVAGAVDADLLMIAVGAELVVVPAIANGVSISGGRELDASPGDGVVSLDGLLLEPGQRLPGGVAVARRVLWTLGAAEASGGARAAMERAVAYAKQREQFGRAIGSFQAVKHLCANMMTDTELATAAAWDATRAAADDAELDLTAAVAATVAGEAYVRTAERTIQVHAGIGYTWEHDAQLFLRRALALRAGLTDGANPTAAVLRLASDGVVRRPAVALPPEAAGFREAARTALAAIEAAEPERRREVLVDSGYFVPHWPRPWGRDAGAVEQLVIDEEFAGVERVDLGITGWVVLTLAQHAAPDQADRWVRRTLLGELVWCQLFSEPGAGSDAAAVSTRGVRTEGGWLVTGQKVWTSDAQDAHFGLATIRTDSSGGKHAGITMMVVDLQAPGVLVRPLRDLTGAAIFNEVFLDEVFVPDSDVVGEVGQGWRLARATLSNERITIGARKHDDRAVRRLLELAAQCGVAPDAAITAEVATLLAEEQAIQALGLRQAARAVEGTDRGPEGNVSKLLAGELTQRMAGVGMRIAGMTAFGGHGDSIRELYLYSRCLTIAGGTSEIVRNQIAERILGLPREPGLR